MDINTYLDTIGSKSPNQKYKRVSLSPIRYAGGKSKAIGLILENMPELKEKKIISPFFGGGSLEVVLAQKLGFEIIGYDIFGMLVNFWQILLKDNNSLAFELSKLIPDKEHYTLNRHILLHYWDKIKPETLEYKTKKKIELTTKQKNMLDSNPLLQATYYYYNMQLSYGPMFLGWASNIYLTDKRYQNIINKIRNFKSGSISVNQASFEESIPKHNEEFLFLDPPYYLGDDSKMFKGMYPNCNFAIHHNDFPHEKLRDLLYVHKGGFIMTYNNCSIIREWYKNYKQVFPSWQYTYGQGEKRIGKNRKDCPSSQNLNIKKSHEIIIVCPPIHS